MKGFRYLENVATLRFTSDKCTGCGRCVEVCPHQVFEPAGEIVAVVDRDACMECGACRMNCPHDAIQVDAGVGCASGLLHEWLRERNLSSSNRSCCS
jgi:NAD-dependent dihydropyrimidine dehydrogenase PreA subunit